MQLSPTVVSPLVGLAVVVAACDSHEEAAEAVDEVSEEAADEAIEDPAPSGDDGPRFAEARAPDDARVGVLPEGVGVPVGQKVEPFTLTDGQGEEVALAELWKEQKVMLVFYRGGWCPFCNFQIRELTSAYAQFEERGVTPVAVSVDKPDESARTAATYDIPFPVLSDPDLVAHRSFQVLNEMEGHEVERLRGMGMDVRAHSGRDHDTVAIPGIFVVDGEGVVRWAHAHEDYRVRPSTEQLLRAIDALDE